ncbi:MAG: 4Fe-4S binding protein [Desulfuromonadales bacterium]|nr:4Fe-4S binding protein [Desulfuromonadales bacterium]
MLNSNKNLLEVPILGPLLRSPWPWRLLRLVLLLMTLLMIAYGWHQHAIPGVVTPDPLMYTNLATYFFWNLWIMAIVFVALFLGRAWCTICPVGWLNGLVIRFGLKRDLPPWLRNFVPVTLTLVVVQLSVYLFAVHRFPDYTAWLLAVVLLLAILCGLIFRKRTFCSLLCPAGAVFGLYARLAPLELRVKEQGICAACDSKDCVSGAPLWKRFSLGPALFYWRGNRSDCPADLVTAEICDSASCSLCLHCVQNCEKENIRISWRPWLADLHQGKLPTSEAFFFVVLLGMITANFAKVFTELREVIFAAPQQLALALGWGTNGFYFFSALWVTLVFPLLLILPGYLLVRLGSAQIVTVPAGELENLPEPSPPPTFWSIIGRLALSAIPMILAAHVVLAVVKLNAKGAYLPFVLQDPAGVQSYLAMNVMNTVNQPGVLIPLDILKWLVLALLLLGYGLAIIAARRVARSQGKIDRSYLAGAITVVTILAAIYGSTVIRWLFIR